MKTSFFRRIHLTGGWTQAQYPSTHTYGIVGMQVGVLETGRFTLPAIGVMLLMIPDGRGGHEWKPATTLGFGLRLFDFEPLRRGKQRASISTWRERAFMAAELWRTFRMANASLVGLSISADTTAVILALAVMQTACRARRWEPAVSLGIRRFTHEPRARTRPLNVVAHEMS